LLVAMSLNLNRLENSVHIRDMIEVGLVDQSWLKKVPAELKDRLQRILDTPDG
jgi:hypothetical protein